MTEAERLARLAHELTTRVGGAVKDMIPPEAQHHLLNAQRELLTAFFLIYEHQAGGRRPEPAPPRRRTSTARTSTARTSRSRAKAASDDRLRHIDIE